MSYGQFSYTLLILNLLSVFRVSLLGFLIHIWDDIQKGIEIQQESNSLYFTSHEPNEVPNGDLTFFF